MRTTNLRFVIFFILLMLSVFACSKKEQTDGNMSETKSRKISKVGISYALGGKGDLTYNDASYKGVEKLQKLGISIKEFEPATLDDYAKGLDLLSLSDVQVIFCIGFLYDEPVKRIASNHRDILYVILDGSASEPSNVVSIKFNAYEGSVLAGVVAGKLTQNQKVAFVGGTNIPIINEFLEGFKEGVKMVDENISLTTLYVGTGGTAFTDPVKGREVALSAISRGADVIYHAAGSSGNGVIKAAKESNIYAIGVDVDQSHLAPGTVVTSVLKNFDVVMMQVIKQLDAGQNWGGQNITLGLKEGAVSLAPIDETVKGKIGDLAEKAKIKILNQNFRTSK